MQQEFLDISSRRPTIRLGIPPMLSTIFFPDLMDAFHEKKPEVYLEMSEYGSVRACDMVQNEMIDIGLVNMELYNADKFSSEVLAVEKLLFCVSKDHPLAGLESIALEQLDRMPLILFNTDSVQNHILTQSFSALGIQPRIILCCSQITTTLKFVRQGKCGCFFFSSMLPHIPDIVGIPVTPEIPTKIGLVWKKGKYISTHMQSFIKFCSQYYARHPLVGSLKGRMPATN